MNIAKNMEAIFVATLVVIGATSLATAAVPKLQRAVAPAPVVTVTVQNDAAMPVVVVSAKRLTAAEKAASGAEFAYTRGAIGVMDLLDARRQLYATRLELAVRGDSLVGQRHVYGDQPHVPPSVHPAAGVVHCLRVGPPTQHLPFGRLSPEGGAAAYAYIAQAVELALAGRISAVCTATRSWASIVFAPMCGDRMMFFAFRSG